MQKWKMLANAVAEFAPIITFVGFSEVFDFYVGLKAMIVVAILSFLLSYLIERRIPKFGLIASGTILLFGIMSILTKDPFYIIFKDTLYASSFAILLLVGIIFKRSYLEVLFGDFFAMTERGWKILTMRWFIFFCLLAVSNEIARHLWEHHPNIWVMYKFAAVVATNIFGFYQFTLARRERLPEANEWGLRI